MPMKVYMKNTKLYMLMQTVNAIENLFMDGHLISIIMQKQIVVLLVGCPGLQCVKTISIYNFF